MTKKELNRAKRALKSGIETVERIATCYVTPEKNLFPQPPVSYPTMSAEEGERYLELFRKVLTGPFGKALHEVVFPLDAEGEGSGHELLYAIREDSLRDADRNAMLFERIAASYDSPDPYCILALYATTSLPSGRSEDMMEDLDNNDDVYRYILIAVCPIAPAKPALAYSPAEQKIESTVPGQPLSAPTFGLLFPVLTEGTPDIHGMICQTKKQEERDEKLVSDAFQCVLPKSADAVQDDFAQMLHESLGQACTYENIAGVESKLLAMAQPEGAEDTEELRTVNARQFAALVRETAGETAGGDIEAIYQSHFGEEEVRVDQAIPQRTVLKDTEFSINCSAEAAERVKIMRVDGKMCVVLPLNGQAEVNGITVESWNLEPAT